MGIGNEAFGPLSGDLPGKGREGRPAPSVERDMQAIFGRTPAPLPAISGPPITTLVATGATGFADGRRWRLWPVLGFGALIAVLALLGYYFWSARGSEHDPALPMIATRIEGQDVVPPPAPREAAIPSAPPSAPREAATPPEPETAPPEPAATAEPAVVREAKVAAPRVARRAPPAPAPARPSCRGSSYERMPSCPPEAVIAADRQLGQAYAAAIHADVDRAFLAQYSQRWSQLRNGGSGDPGATAAAYRIMARELDARSAGR